MKKAIVIDLDGTLFNTNTFDDIDVEVFSRA